MLLAVDVGNTNVVVGVFDRESLNASWRLATDARKMTDEYAVVLRALLEHHGIPMRAIDGVCISSTVPALTATFRELAERYFQVAPIIAHPNIRTGVAVLADNPLEVGPDRIVNALAAMRRHRVPAIVVDMGTATTFDAVSGKGELLGCVIAPGIASSMEGLVAGAARLFSVELKAPRRAIGRNTVGALRSGAVFGYVGLVEGLLARIRAEMDGDPMIIATGGLAPIVVEATDVFDLTDPDLTLHGLRYLHELNTAPSPVSRQELSRDRTAASGDGADVRAVHADADG